jgi:hypothetical protein
MRFFSRLPRWFLTFFALGFALIAGYMFGLLPHWLLIAWDLIVPVPMLLLGIQLGAQSVEDEVETAFNAGFHTAVYIYWPVLPRWAKHL